MKLFNIFKRKKVNKQLSEEEILEDLWKKWIKGNIPSPLNELMIFISNLGAMGHADFFELCDKNGDLSSATEIALPLLPQTIRNNFFKAKAIYNSTPINERSEDFLEQFDDFFYDNEPLLDDLLLSYIKENNL